jgi:hypothetical protein
MRQPMPLRLIRDEIAEAIDDGATLGEVQDRVIGDRPLSPEARDALWLYAWASLEHRPLRLRRQPWEA